MFTDKLLMILGLTLFNGAVLNEPQRVNDFQGYEIINATDKNFELYNVGADESQTITAKTRTIFNWDIDTSRNWTLTISYQDYPTKPTNFYYIYNASDFEEPVNITFNEVPAPFWSATITGYEPSRGLQIGTYENLTGMTYYYDNAVLSNLQTSSIVGEEQTINLLDNGRTAKIQKEDGSFTSTLSEIDILIQSLGTGYQHIMYLLYVENGQNFIMASNINYNQVAQDPQNVQKALNPYLTFFDGYTNKVIFQSGKKSVKYGSMNGLDPYGFTPNNYGYKGEQGQIGENNAGWSALEAGILLVGKSFDVVSGFFSWVIFPGITLGLLLLFPILLCMLLWIIKLVKKG